MKDFYSLEIFSTLTPPFSCLILQHQTSQLQFDPIPDGLMGDAFTFKNVKSNNFLMSSGIKAKILGPSNGIDVNPYLDVFTLPHSRFDFE